MLHERQPLERLAFVRRARHKEVRLALEGVEDVLFSKQPVLLGTAKRLQISRQGTFKRPARVGLPSERPAGVGQLLQDVAKLAPRRDFPFQQAVAGASHFVSIRCETLYAITITRV